MGLQPICLADAALWWGGLCTTSRGNMPVPLRWAMPCADVPLSALYTRTRKSPDEGESFLSGLWPFLKKGWADVSDLW